jgi:DNA-binding response OmpR family regulator
MHRDTTARNRHILVVDTTDGPLPAVLEALLAEGRYRVECVGTAADCLSRAGSAATPLDAVIIGAHLPDGSGAELCARLRDHGVTIPLLLTQRDTSERAMIDGLDSGANDIITLPLRASEAMARLRAQIRAYETSEDAMLQIGPFHFRPARRMLQDSKSGSRIRLTEKEAAVLKYLYRAEGPVSRNQLLREVWGYHNGATTHTVETHIYRLRRKIEPDSSRIGLLVNEEGGYRLCLSGPTVPATIKLWDTLDRSAPAHAPAPVASRVLATEMRLLSA